MINPDGNLRSDALLRIKPSATMAMTDQARRLRAAGLDVIALSGGQPDFDTPQNIKDAAKRAIDQGKTKYPPAAGIAELRAAIVEKFNRENNLSFDVEQIIVSVGGKQVISSALLATVNPGDEVLIPAPYWVSYPEIVTFAGASPVIIPTTGASGYKLTGDALAKAITPKTRWLILNSPSNPSGAVYSRDELKALTDVPLKNPHVWLLSDDIYEHLVYDGIEFVTPVQIEPALKNRSLTINGVSKAYAMTGWRVGYAGGPRDLISAMAAIQSQLTSGTSVVSQWASVEALSGPQDFLLQRRAAFRARRDFLAERLAQTPGLGCTVPQGAFYMFVSIADLIGKQTPDGQKIDSDETFARELLARHHVAVVQGSAFGAPNHFRASYAAAMGELEKAADRILKFCSSLR